VSSRRPSTLDDEEIAAAATAADAMLRELIAEVMTNRP
jgi:hypothetical protein